MKQIFVLLFALSVLFSAHAQERDSAFVFPYKSGNKWTFRSQTGFLPKAPFFDSIILTPGSSYFGYFKVVVKVGGKYGVVQYTDQFDTLLPIEYNAVKELSPESYILRKNDQWSAYSIANWDYKKQRFVWSLEDFGKLDSLYTEKGVAYFWKDGKMGLKNGGNKTIFSKYSYIAFFDKSRYNSAYQDRLEEGSGNWYKEEREKYYLVSDRKRFGLMQDSKELIPCTAECVQAFNNSFCRYWNGNYWVYVRYKDGFKIDPKGESVVFYADNIWKVYSGQHKTSTLYKNGVSFPVKAFDDYFLLSKEYVAVRRADKIGLLTKNGVVLIQPQYEQIDYLGSNFFRVLAGGKWYLSHSNGVFLTKTGYDFISDVMTFDGKKVFEIHQNGKSGMLWSNGTELLDPKFLSVRIVDDFLFAKEKNLVSVFGSGGKKITSKNYIGFRIKNDFLLLYLNKSDKDFCTRFAQLNQNPFRQIADLGEVVKLYGENQLEVLVFNSKRTILEERQVYPGSVSFKVKGFEEDERISFSDEHDLSYLEENQLSGFFGYRKTFETNHIMKPDFLECFDYGLFNWEIGVRNYEKKILTTSDGLTFTSFFDFRIIDPASAEWFDDLVSYTSFSSYNEHVGGTSSDAILAHSTVKGNFWLYNQSHAASEVKALNYSGVNSFAYYLGGNYVNTDPANSFTISNYERFRKMNQALNLAPVNEGIAEVMNPGFHKRLTGGKWYVKEITSYEAPNKMLVDKYYTELNYLEGSYFENPTFIARNESGNWIWNFQKGDSVENTAYSGIVPYDDFIMVEANSKKGICLKNREILLEPVYDEIYVLTEDLLLVRKESEYGVMDFNKTWIVPLKE